MKKNDSFLDLIQIRKKSTSCKEHYRRWVQERIKKGYCHWDLLDTDVYLTHVIASMLKEFSEIATSWPQELFETMEEWKVYLNGIAEDLLFAEKLHNNYYPEESKKFLENAFSKLVKIWFYLWE